MFLQVKRRKTKITDIHMMKKGMQVCIERPLYNHHLIVSNVMPLENRYEIINMTGDLKTIFDENQGIAEIRKEVKDFNANDNMSFYDYGENSIDAIIRKKYNMVEENSIESIVPERASLLHEAFETLRDKLWYNVPSFNCEHFASYCATGLAFCKQKQPVTKKENIVATDFLDKK